MWRIRRRKGVGRGFYVVMLGGIEVDGVENLNLGYLQSDRYKHTHLPGRLTFYV